MAKKKKQQPRVSGNPQLQDPELIAEARKRGMKPLSLVSARAMAQQMGVSVEEVLASAKEVDTVVAGQGATQELQGLMTATDDPSKIVGALPGSKASKLTPEQIAQLTGWDADDLTASVFPKATKLRTSTDPVDQGVWQRLRETTLEGAEGAAQMMARDSAAAADEAGFPAPPLAVASSTVASPSGGRSPALDMASMMMGWTPPSTPSEGRAMMRAQGYVPTDEVEDGRKRLDEILVNDSELLDEVRKLSPTLGITEGGEWVGMEDPTQDKVDKLMAELAAPGATPEVTEARRALLDRIKGTFSPLLSPAELAPGVAELIESAEEIDAEKLTRVIAMTLDSFLGEVRPGWGLGLGPKELKHTDVTLTPRAGVVEVRVTGDLADATVLAAMIAAADDPTITPEVLAERVIGPLDTPRRLRVVEVEPSGNVTLQGASAEERARSLACQRQVQTMSSEEERAASTLLPMDGLIPISYVGMAHLVGGSKIARLPVTVSEERLRQMRQDKFAMVGCAVRVQRDGAPTVVRLGLHVHIRDRRTHSTIWVHDVDPLTAEALMGTGPQIPARRSLRESLLAGLPDEYRLGTEDRPRWAGARAFDAVWDRAQTTARAGHEAQDRGLDVVEFMAEHERMTPALAARTRATIGYSIQTLGNLKRAQEVLIDPDQVNMLPSFDSWEEAVRFAADVQLPFEHVFIDLEGPAGACVTEQAIGTVDGMRLAIRGACVERRGDGALVIMPYGNTVAVGDDVDRLDTYGTLGQVTFGGLDPRLDKTSVWAQQVVQDDGFMFTNIAADANVALGTGRPTKTESGEDALMVELGEVVEPSGAACYTLLDASDGTEYDRQHLAIYVTSLRSAGLAVLRSLFLLTMSNVELVEGGSRQVRRAALRRDPDALISLAVKVVTNRKDYTHGRGDGDGSRREYSHRFRRRGSVAHYPIGTRMADAAPDKVVACGRCGRCRRIFRPATIVGPEDKPLILKSLVVD